MKQMLPIQCQYPFDQSVWLEFARAHYGSQPGVRWRAVLSLLCLMAGCAGVAGYYPNKISAMLLLVTGFIGLSATNLLALRRVGLARRHPFFGKMVTVIMDEEDVTLRCGNQGMVQPWQNFSRYRQVNAGMLLYYGPDSFIMIPQSALSDLAWKTVIDLLENHQVGALSARR
nr:YcxB family protein [uncultured Desulfuromonas sp.]